MYYIRVPHTETTAEIILLKNPVSLGRNAVMRSLTISGNFRYQVVNLFEYSRKSSNILEPTMFLTGVKPVKLLLDFSPKYYVSL